MCYPSFGDMVAEVLHGSRHNYSSSTAPHHCRHSHSSIDALSGYINSLELKVIDFLQVFYVVEKKELNEINFSQN